MTIFLTIIHVLVSLALIGIVLLQRGKGADMGAAFGGASQAVFGTSGATTFLGKLTATAAVVFMITSIGLGLMGRSNTDSDFFTEQPAATTAPAQMPAGAAETAPVQADDQAAPVVPAEQQASAPEETK
ncbi:MAG: preprotein translocase subunit SecG [Deltaproteobacteria bacterium]|mgnify:CR=1 FL=1|nr:MAG: preprotein translocase subunit SecG [Deltaproteobacteria bacterium]